MFPIADYNAAPGPILQVVNGSTGTIEKYMYCIGGIGINWTTALDVDPSLGQSPPTVVPGATNGLVAQVFGVAADRILPGKRGTLLRRGMTFVRVAGQALNLNQQGVTSSVVGTIIGSTGNMPIFFCSITASPTIFLGTTRYDFTVSHAYGFFNCEAMPI